MRNDIWKIFLSSKFHPGAHIKFARPSVQIFRGRKILNPKAQRLEQCDFLRRGSTRLISFKNLANLGANMIRANYALTHWEKVISSFVERRFPAIDKQT